MRTIRARHRTRTAPKNAPGRCDQRERRLRRPPRSCRRMGASAAPDQGAPEIPERTQKGGFMLMPEVYRLPPTEKSGQREAADHLFRDREPVHGATSSVVPSETFADISRLDDVSSGSLSLPQGMPGPPPAG